MNELFRGPNRSAFVEKQYYRYGPVFGSVFGPVFLDATTDWSPHDSAVIIWGEGGVAFETGIEVLRVRQNTCLVHPGPI